METSTTNPVLTCTIHDPLWPVVKKWLKAYAIPKELTELSVNSEKALRERLIAAGPPMVFSGLAPMSRKKFIKSWRRLLFSVHRSSVSSYKRRRQLLRIQKATGLTPVISFPDFIERLIESFPKNEVLIYGMVECSMSQRNDSECFVVFLSDAILEKIIDESYAKVFY